MNRERKTIRRIREGIHGGRIPEPFKSADINKALGIHWAGVFLPKHRVGNSRGETELFEQTGRGLYRLK